MDMRAARPPGLNFVYVAVSKDTSPEAPLSLYAAPKQLLGLESDSSLARCVSAQPLGLESDSSLGSERCGA